MSGGEKQGIKVGDTFAVVREGEKVKSARKAASRSPCQERQWQPCGSRPCLATLKAMKAP